MEDETDETAALAMPHNPLLRGGTGGGEAAPEPFTPALAVVGETTGDTVGGGVGSAKLGTSSSQILSTTPVRMNLHKLHVVRRRVRHQREVQRGYIVTGVVVAVVEEDS
jgi:hypothetical protein